MRCYRPRAQAPVPLLALVCILLAGCGADPLRDELHQYWRNVARPATSEREAALKEMRSLFMEAMRGGPGAHKMHEKLREEVIGHLDRALKLFRDYKAKAPIVAELNGYFVTDAEDAIKQVEAIARAIEKENEAETKASMEKLTEFNKMMAELVSDLETLSLKHGLELKM